MPWVLQALPAWPVHSDLSVLPGGGGGGGGGWGGRRRRRVPGGGADACRTGSEAERSGDRETEERGPGADQLRKRDDRSLLLQQGDG